MSLPKIHKAEVQKLRKILDTDKDSILLLNKYLTAVYNVAGIYELQNISVNHNTSGTNALISGEDGYHICL